MTPYEELPEVQDAMAEHHRKRAEQKLELRRLGARWSWRVYYGRYVSSPKMIHWAEYEEGITWTRLGARRAARRRLRHLERTNAPWVATVIGAG